MPKYTQDMRRAAHRHLEAGENLRGTARHDVAGYLFGIAAECALKFMMSMSGMRPLPEAQRRDDPFYAHFEELKTLLRDNASGRLATELLRFATKSSLMQRWDISMRYSRGSEIERDWVNKWHSDAKDIIGTMDL